MKNKIYLYLARRDKKGIKILTCFANINNFFPTRINDLKQLNFSEEVYKSINKEVVENKMLYDLWIESANSFESLKKSLIKRGYSNLPLQKSVLYSIKDKKEIKYKSEGKTMLRKGSQRFT